MNAKHLTIASALLAAPLLAQPAFATITYSESISSITSSVTGQPSFSGEASFTAQSLSTPYTENPFFIGSPAGSGSGTETSTITVSFSFSDSSGGTGSLSNKTGAFSADYTNTTDWVIWTGETGGSGTEQTGGIATYDVTLSDNAEIQVQLYDQMDWDLQPKAVFTLVDSPAVPEPGSLALLGTALAGLALLGAARRRWSL